MLLNDMHKDWDIKDNDIRPGIATLHTNGSGFWTRLALSVRVTELDVAYINESEDFGELRVHFNTDDWRCDKMGLIYTDPLFMQQLQEFCDSLGLKGRDVCYSEQGMQGDNYVSCDIGKQFLTGWKSMHTEKYKETYKEIHG